MKLLSGFLLYFLLFCGVIHAKTPEMDNPFSKKCSYAEDLKVSLFHRDGSGIGYNKGYTSLRLFYIPKLKKFTPFIDFRVHMFNNGRPASNVGLGIRKLVGSKYLCGINGFYDYRSAKKLNQHQFGAGFEFLARSFELYMNGYIPFGKKTFEKDPVFDHFVGRELIVSQERRSSLAHLDLFARYRMYKNCDSHITPGIGSYYLFRRSKSFGRMGDALGVKGQIRAQLLQYLTLGFDVSYDKIFKTRYEGTVGLSFPLSTKKRKVSKCIAKVSHCFLQRDVQRDEIIPIDKKELEYPLINPLTNEPYQFIFVNNDSGSNGTFEDPFPTITEAIDVSAPHDIVYVFPGSTEYGETFFMKDTLRLQGSGHGFILEGVNIPALTTNIPLIDLNVSRLITLANDNIVNGFRVGNGLGITPIIGIGITNATIQNCIAFAGTFSARNIALTDVDGNIQVLDCSGNASEFSTIVGLSILINDSKSAKVTVERNNFIRQTFINGNVDINSVCVRFRDNIAPNGYNIARSIVESPDGTQAGVEEINQGAGTFSNVVFTKKVCQ